MPNTIRCLARLQHIGGNPEDVYQNTLHFHNPLNSPLAVAADALEVPVATFYNTMAAKMSNVVSDSLEMRFYDLDDIPPREPETRVLPITFGNVAEATLPEELCVALTIHGNPPVTSRRRGRVYCGPWGAAALGYTTTASPMVADAVVTQVWNAAVNLMLDTQGSNWPWSIYSRKYDITTVVTGGWVDNAFDIQRRRGAPATSRTPFGSGDSFKFGKRDTASLTDAPQGGQGSERQSRPPA